MTGQSSSRWAGSITKFTHDQWALARRGQLARIHSLRAGVETITHRLAQPVGARGAKGVPGGYRSEREWFAKSRRPAPARPLSQPAPAPAGPQGHAEPTAYLINTSRAAIVDQDALLAALHEGRIAGAGVDVFDVEPLPAGHPMRTAPRLLATPHLGYVSQANYATYYGDAVEDIQAYLTGDPVRRLG